MPLQFLAVFLQPGSAAGTLFEEPMHNVLAAQIQGSEKAASAAETYNTEKDMPLRGVTIGIEPGHQAKANSGLEPNAPGSKKMKKKVSSGTRGIYTKVNEYKLNFEGRAYA